MYRLLSIIAILAFYSCANSVNYEVKETFESGEPKVRIAKLSAEGDTYLHEELYETGQVKITGKMQNNKRIGQWKAYYEDGKIWSIGDYENGERHGISKVYNPDGVPVMSGFFKNGKVDGLWATFTPDGDTLQVTVYKEGSLVRSYDKTVVAPVR